MIIELIGLPGSGKTSLIKELSEGSGVPIIRPPRVAVYFYSALFMLRHPFQSAHLMWFTSREAHMPALFFHKLRVVLIPAMAKEQCARMADGGIIDEGLLLFVTLGLFEREVSEEEIGEVLRSVSLPARRVVLVDASPAVRYERMVQRGRIPRERFGREYQERIAEVLEHNWVQAKPVIRRAFPDSEIRSN